MPSRLNSKTLRVIEDPDIPGGLLLELTNDLCREVGWNVGDTLEWIDNNDGTWSLKKVEAHVLQSK